MKDKGKTVLNRLLIAMLAVSMLIVMLWLADNVFNGWLVEWFYANFILEIAYPVSEVVQDLPEDGMVYFEEFNWVGFKLFLSVCAIVVTAFLLLTAFLVSSITRRRTERKVIQDLHAMIPGYMTRQVNTADVFHDKYSEIAADVADIKSEMLRNEQILKDETAKKNDLITYLAHDLKTPLTSVIGYLSLLEEVPGMPAKQKAKYVHISLDKALRLERLINEFFEITRFNLQEIRLEKETVDLTYMLIQMTDEFYPLLKEHHNTIKVEAGGDITVYADSEKLARVFNNILKNAAAYSYPGSLIVVKAACKNDKVYISFQNEGKTIPKYKLDLLFEKFFRMDEARASNTGGAGLGLAIAKEIVLLHGGTITAESDKEVTTFTVTLPA